MEGKTHFFYGFMIASTFMILLSMSHTQNVLYSLLLIGNGIAIIIYKIADFYGLKVSAIEKEHAEKKKQAKKTQQEVTEEKNSDAYLYRKKDIYYTSIAWTCNLVLILLTIFTADFIDSSISRSSSIYAFIGILLGFAGSFFCDIDTLIFGIQAHRNPITHSYIVPFIIWWYAFLVGSYEERFMILFPAMFALGVASHLMLDRVPSTAGFVAGLKATFGFKEAPGDIRHIPEVWESAYLLISGLLLLTCFGLSVPRFYGTHGFTWSFVDYTQLSGNPFVGILIFGILGFAGWIGILVAGMLREKQKHK